MLTWNSSALLQGQPGVPVGAHEQAPSLAQVLQRPVQLHVAEVLVEAHHHRLHLRVQGHVGPVVLLPRDQVGSGSGLPDPHRLQLLLHGGAPDQVHLALQPADALQVPGAAVRGPEDLLLADIKAQGCHFVRVHLSCFGAVVGDEEDMFALLFEQVDDLRRSGDGLVSAPDHPVTVEQDAVHRVQQLFYQRSVQPDTFGADLCRRVDQRCHALGSLANRGGPTVLF